MSYCEPADLTGLFPAAELLQLADDSGEALGLDDPIVAAVLAEAIAQADREIDAYVGLVQTVPLVPPLPGLVANLSAKMAIWRLMARRPHMATDLWAREYERCLSLLKSVGEGRLSLGAGAGGEPASPQGGQVKRAGAPVLFGALQDLF